MESLVKFINSGDCYILVILDKVIIWVGEFVNVIEKVKVGVICWIIFVIEWYEYVDEMCLVFVGCRYCYFYCLEERFGY